MGIFDINGNILVNESAVFSDNISIDYCFDEDSSTNYYVVKVFKTKKDGTQQFPFVRVPSLTSIPYSALDLAQIEGWDLIMNAGLTRLVDGTWLPTDGIAIENGVLLHDSPAEWHIGSMPITIDGNGNLGYTATDPSGATLISQGIVSAIMGFCPIIVDYEPVSHPTIQNIAANYWTAGAQRQIIGQYGNGDYCIVTCDGRDFNNSTGWKFAEEQAICQKLGLKFAYQCDGGGSTETVVGKKQLNMIYQDTTGRRITSFIVFNGTTTFSIPEP